MGIPATYDGRDASASAGDRGYCTRTTSPPHPPRPPTPAGHSLVPDRHSPPGDGGLRFVHGRQRGGTAARRGQPGRRVKRANLNAGPRRLCTMVETTFGSAVDRCPVGGDGAGAGLRRAISAASQRGDGAESAELRWPQSRRARLAALHERRSSRRARGARRVDGCLLPFHRLVMLL